ncbi:MAG: hypothetical protein AAB227_12625 [Pseudomonadota bacterium]
MTPVRALLASLFAAILLGAGAFIAASLADGRPHDLLPLLSLGRAPFSLWCFLAAWGAVLFGALGILAAFLAFIAPEEDADPHFRRRGFPKGAPILLIAIALGLLWFALRCAGETSAPPIAVPVMPAPAAPVDSELLGEAPEIPEPASAPTPVADAAAYQWPFKVPLVRGDSAADLAGERLFPDETENRRLFCGKAWIAVTGSSSEEGPADRNWTRARMRASAAQRAVNSWLAEHPDCGRPIVIGVNLGQHSPIAGDGDDGAASAYQRQVLVVSRARFSAEETLSAAAAQAELRAFLDDPASRAALYGGRTFAADPQILSPLP